MWGGRGSSAKQHWGNFLGFAGGRSSKKKNPWSWAGIWDGGASTRQENRGWMHEGRGRAEFKPGLNSWRIIPRGNQGKSRTSFPGRKIFFSPLYFIFFSPGWAAPKLGRKRQRKSSRGAGSKVRLAGQRHRDTDPALWPCPPVPKCHMSWFPPSQLSTGSLESWNSASGGILKLSSAGTAPTGPGCI